MSKTVATASPALVKSEVQLPDVMIGVIMGVLLTTGILIDLSVVTYILSTGNVSLASSYVLQGVKNTFLLPLPPNLGFGSRRLFPDNILSTY